MKCSFCDSETSKGIQGPNDYYICYKCIEGLSDLDGIEINGNCSWCGEKIGKAKGIFKKNMVLAVAVNNDSNITLCSECGKLCQDIIENEVTA